MFDPEATAKELGNRIAALEVELSAAKKAGEDKSAVTALKAELDALKSELAAAIKDLKGPPKTPAKVGAEDDDDQEDPEGHYLGNFGW